MLFAFDIQALVQHIFYEAALFAAIGYLVIGIDEIAIDLIWLARSVWLLVISRRTMPPLSVELLPASPDRAWFAVLIPAWEEHRVIGSMLAAACERYASDNVHLFVGCYPNDLPTIDIVRRFEGPKLSFVIVDRKGPTTKGHCLNTIYRSIPGYEQRVGRRFSGFVLHDAEDVVDRDEIAVFDAFVDRYAMIQLPVIPLPSKGSRWISRHYCDEFAESHTKTMVVRQALGAALPSAGVGCMIRRDAIEALARQGEGRPFDGNSATEDYEVGLRISALGFKTAFLRVRADNKFGLVSTTAHFPTTLEDAVTQKTRWVSGIALAGWDRMHWGRGLAENWMRARDRSSILAAIVSLTGYAVAAVGLLLVTSDYLELSQPIRFDGTFVTLVWINGLVLLWRMAMRCFFVTRLYGLTEGFFSLPRILVSSVIGILSVRRAIPKHLRELREGKVDWEKTTHTFPDAIQ